jgi:hypothetical protein
LAPEGNQSLIDIHAKASRNQNSKVEQVLDGAKDVIKKSEEDRSQYVTNPLRQTRKAWVNPLPSTKSHLNKAMRLQRQEEKRSKTLAELRKQIIEHLTRE